MKRKIIMTTTAATTIFSMLSINVFADVNDVTASYTTDQAIERYNEYYDDYQADEGIKIQQYRENYKQIKGSLADQIIERAIWYLENGYTVYGHGLISYHTNGVVDCSEFTRLVYGDFNFPITDVAEDYASVGTPIAGIKPVQNENGTWGLEGTQNLRPGDLLTWWALDEKGSKYISHVAIYMGEINGQPAVIGTTTEDQNDPTAIGIVNNFNYWYGSNFFSAQRLLPEGAWSPEVIFDNHIEEKPVIPESYTLPPQKEIVMPEVPENPYTDPIVLTNYGWVSVNAEPSTTSSSIGNLIFGQKAPLIRQYNKYWYEIEFNGQIGYVTTNSEYTHTENFVYVPPVYDGPVVLTNNGWVGVYESPNSTSTSLGKLQLGQAATLVKKYNNYWYQIEFNGKTGYITTNEKYTHTENFVEEAPAYDGPVVLTNNGWVGVYESPNSTSTSLGKLQLGQAATLVKKYNNYWYQIEFNGKTGYITTNEKYTHTENFVETPVYDGPVVLTNNGWVGVFASPNSTSTSLGKLQLGQAATLIKKYNNYWYQIEFNGKTGYITANEKYTHTENFVETPVYDGPVVLTNNGWVGVFTSPNSTSSSLGKLQLGQAATLIKKYNNYWYQIQFNGKTGYITANEKYTHTENFVETPVYDGPVVLTNNGWVGVFESPNSTSTNLGKLQLGQAATLVKKYNNYWYQIEFNGKTGYITANEKYTHTENFVEAAPAKVGPVVLTNNGWVGVFASPKSTSTSLGRLQLGQSAPLVKKYNNYWYEIIFNGKSGFITASAKYTHVVEN